jgi:hypothetical protein
MARAVCFSAPLSGAFPPTMPAGLKARVSRLGGFTRPLSGSCFPQLGVQLFVITGEAATSRSRSTQFLMEWCFAQCNDFRKVLIATCRARQHHQQCEG